MCSLKKIGKVLIENVKKKDEAEEGSRKTVENNSQRENIDDVRQTWNKYDVVQGWPNVMTAFKGQI